MEDNYKSYEDDFKKNRKGLGTSISKITKATGLDVLADSVAKALGFDDCGCEKRKQLLDEMFPLKSPECLTEEEWNYLTKWFKLGLDRPPLEDVFDRNKLFDIHNRVFNKEQYYTNCGSCVRKIVSDLKLVVSV